MDLSGVDGHETDRLVAADSGAPVLWIIVCGAVELALAGIVAAVVWALGAK
jgi:hypothetical protein